MRIQCPVPPMRAGTGCLYDADSDACVAVGILNVAVGGSYSLNLSVASGLFEREMDIPVVGEPNGMNVESAAVEIQLPDGSLLDFGDAALPNPFSVTTTGRLPVGAAGLVRVKAIPRDYVLAMEKQALPSEVGTLVVQLQLRGRTDGQVDVDSGIWRWPVELINENLCIEDTGGDLDCQPGQDSDAIPRCIPDLTPTN